MNAPEKIYLQIQDDNEISTWCEDRTNDDDIGYVRMDIANDKIADLQHNYNVREGAWIERGNITKMLVDGHKDKEKELADLRAKVEEYRKWIAEGKYTQAEICRKEGISTQLMSLIKLRKIWRHV